MTEELCGTSFSKGLVSSLAGSLDSELEAWRARRLAAEAYPYLFVDARHEKVRIDGRVVSRGVLIISGVRDDGMCEILGVEVADTESEATYQEMFRSLKICMDRLLGSPEVLFVPGLCMEVNVTFIRSAWISALANATGRSMRRWIFSSKVSLANYADLLVLATSGVPGRNALQQWARQKTKNPLPIRVLQTPATPSNH